ncbi:MAG TPA: phytoene/squalene synthase family protein [Burkholderiales bacterium]|nr:phytoene/squalene synthase family protein [Burkholderiales bacterium]
MALVSDEAYQMHVLQGVSRTFALTIPQLPEQLRSVVANAYLLCRIADTIEDEAALDAQRKRRFAEQFIDVVAGRSPAESFADGLHVLLSGNTSQAERDLIRNSAAVIRVTHGFTPAQRAALERCVAIMGEGMAWFQVNQSRDGLPDLPHLDAYCYYVAGVVGEMLTELFCDYSKDIARNRLQLLALAVSFGQALQMTNILKDLWEDRGRGACWLPRDIFLEFGFDLKNLSAERHDAAFARGLRKLIGIAHWHLRNALAYTVLLPRAERGLRKFCLWAIGMALLTLRKIHSNPAFSAGQQVKIARRSVAGTILVTNAFVTRDRMLRRLFDLVAAGLPPAVATAQWGLSRPGPRAGRAAIAAPADATAVTSGDWSA